MHGFVQQSESGITSRETFTDFQRAAELVRESGKGIIKVEEFPLPDTMPAEKVGFAIRGIFPSRYGAAAMNEVFRPNVDIARAERTERQWELAGVIAELVIEEHAVTVEPTALAS